MSPAFDKIVQEVGMDEDPLRRDANLAGVIVATLHHGFDDPVQVGAAIDDGPARHRHARRNSVFPAASLLRRYQPTRAEPI